MLRALVVRRLAEAADEIFGLFERTITEYEEELCRSKEENERQRQLLDAYLRPSVQLQLEGLYCTIDSPLTTCFFFSFLEFLDAESMTKT